ncbi:ABC transporter permease [Aerococcaceae bacterium DSM 111020]|nr:ABC transporter permease [Aerococcaceae bacterium DSM 111020]
MNKLWIIAKHIYKKQVKSAGFIMLVLAPLFFVAFMIAISYFASMSQGASNNNIMMVTDSAEIVEILRETDTNNTLSFTKNIDSAETALQEGTIDGYATLEENDNQIQADVYVPSTNDNIDLTAEENMLNAYRQEKIASQLGITGNVMQELVMNNVSFNRNNVEFTDSGEINVESTNSMDQIIKTGIAYGVVIFLFMLMIFYIQIIAEELAKEKGTRVMEIILSSMSASHHFYGKLLGVSLMLLTHIAIYIVIGFIVFLLNKQFKWIDFAMLNEMGINLGEIIQSQLPMIVWASVFAITGLLIYLSLTGFFTSLATKTEDAQKLNTPMTLIMVVGFYIGIFALTSPYNTVVKIASFIPFWSPFVMPFRVATDSVSQTHLIISLIIAIAFVILCFRLATAFYKSNVLTYSDKGILGRIRQSYTLLKSEREANK